MTGKSRILIVGLGNPGTEYSATRHNAGFMAADFLAGAANWRKEGNYFIKKTERLRLLEKDSECCASNPKPLASCLFIKPLTFMNLSGLAVQAAMARHKIPLENIIIIHDDIDLKLGDVREKTGGGNAGHNGLKSISGIVGNDYRRIRLGVGRPENPERDVMDWVLGRFSKDELPVIRTAIESLEARLF